MNRRSNPSPLWIALMTLPGLAALLAWSGAGYGKAPATAPAPVASAATSAPAATQQANAAARNFYTSEYGHYTPGFLPLRNLWFFDNTKVDDRSSETSYNNMSVVNEDSRVNAAIKVASQREQAGEFREAQPLYQDIIEKMPDVLYRVSKEGVFVRAADYCQMRILAMPPADLAFYRTQYDARAAEAYAEAQRQSSLAGYQEIIDGMLATSWGDKAMMALGRAALDAGRYEEAYRRFDFVKRFFSGGHCDNEELAVLLSLAAKKCGKPIPQLSAGDGSMAEGLMQLRASLPRVTAEPEQIPQRSAPYVSGEDYGVSPVPTSTPLLSPPVWTNPLPNAWNIKEVYSPPVVTDDSVLIRHQNIVYCYSLLTGALRWKNDIGGRVIWQNPRVLSTPMEELVVAGNMVYTNMYKDGASLVALSLTTGELRWAAGPLAGADINVRYEAAPVVEGGVVYAGYVKDDIDGDTYIDTVYGVRGFDAATGQMLWDSPISRLPPSNSTTTVGDIARIKIRSFSTPPACSRGRIYYNTNAGTIASLDARTGRIQWLIRYPYYVVKSDIHDAMESPNAFHFSSGIDSIGTDIHTSLWATQPPLIYHDCLYVAPVDSPLLMAIELSTGKVRWSHVKGEDDKNLNIVRNFLGPGYILGPTRKGELVLAYGSRLTAATVLDADTGKVDWRIGDVLPPENSPALTEAPAGLGGTLERTIRINWAQFQAAARPTLLADDSLVLSSFAYFTFGYVGRDFAYGEARISLDDHKILDSQRYYDAGILSAAEMIITTDAPSQLKFYEGAQAARLKKIMADHVPDNPVGAFKPAQIVTAERYGTVFEVRVASDEISVAYDKPKAEAYLAADQSVPRLQGRAELAMAQRSYSQAGDLLNQCLAKTLPEQTALREKIGGLYHALDLHLAQEDLLRRDYTRYIADASLLLQTSQTLPQEIQSLLAVADGDRRIGDNVGAARALRNVIEHFGSREYSVTPLVFQQNLSQDLNSLLDEAGKEAPAGNYGPEFAAALALMRDAAPLFGSALSPAETTITVNVGDLALAQLKALAKSSPQVAQMLESDARQEFSAAADASSHTSSKAGSTDASAASLFPNGDEGDEREQLLRAYPQTSAGQTALDEMAATLTKGKDAQSVRQAWRLADIAQASGYHLPDALRQDLPHEQSAVPAAAVIPAAAVSNVTFDSDEILRLILHRGDASNEKPNLIFIGGRARRRLDNRFTLECYDAVDGKRLWGDMTLRLKGIGQEPGFFEAFVSGNIVIVHGLYDVLAFDVNDGHLIWRYRVPSNFEIAHVLLAGDELIVSGDTGTLALYVRTSSPVGDLFWQTNEQGALYAAPYVAGDRLVMVRKSPDNVTVRQLGGGELVGRMDLPGLDASKANPVLAEGAEAVPMAHRGNMLLLNDGWNYILIDTQSLSVRWKREIDSNDPATEPPMRIALSDHVAIITKKDYDRSAMYGIDLESGDVRWTTDPDSAGPRAARPAKRPPAKPKPAASSEGFAASSLPPLYDVFVNGDVACGITAPASQTVRAIAFNIETGKQLSAWKSEAYAANPTVRMSPSDDGQSGILQVQQSQKLQLLAFDPRSAQSLVALERDGTGPFGVHGLCSGGVFSGHLVLLTKDGFSVSQAK